jgi:hypothetical protein
MKIFMIEAYGGEHTDGPICHFTVQAESLNDAVELVRQSPRAKNLDRFEVVEETADYEADTPGIISQEDGPHVKPL